MPFGAVAAGLQKDFLTRAITFGLQDLQSFQSLWVTDVHDLYDQPTSADLHASLHFIHFISCFHVFIELVYGLHIIISSYQHSYASVKFLLFLTIDKTKDFSNNCQGKISSIYFAIFSNALTEMLLRNKTNYLRNSLNSFCRLFTSFINAHKIME